MATFYQYLGSIGLRKGHPSEPPIPAGATDLVTFDPSTNAQVIADFDAGYSRFGYVGGVLNRDGSPVNFAADGADKLVRDDLRTQAAAAITSNNTYLALGSPINAQNLAQIRALTQQNNRIIRRLVLLISELGKE